MTGDAVREYRVMYSIQLHSSIGGGPTGTAVALLVPVLDLGRSYGEYRTVVQLYSIQLCSIQLYVFFI